MLAQCGWGISLAGGLRLCVLRVVTAQTLTCQAACVFRKWRFAGFPGAVSEVAGWVFCALCFPDPAPDGDSPGACSDVSGLSR